MKNIVEICCLADDLVKFIEAETKNVGRPSLLSKAEYITLAIMKQKYGIKTNKKLYNFVKYCNPRLFSKLPSYAQFNNGLNSILQRNFRDFICCENGIICLYPRMDYYSIS